MASTEEVTLAREVDSIVIPHGTSTRLPRGTRVKVLQELGGSVTVTTEYGGLYRIDPENLDALGMEVPPPAAAAPADSSQPLEDRVWDVLRTCFDPEIPVNIVELGLVYDCRLGEPEADGRQSAAIQMTLTAPGCGMGDVLAQDIQKKLEKMAEISTARVEVVFDPPWNQSMMSEAARLQLGFY
ncbi:MAG: putative Fe-S cluster assembly protein SufT [Thermoanaerobaculia bacterium]